MAYNIVDPTSTVPQTSPSASSISWVDYYVELQYRDETGTVQTVCIHLTHGWDGAGTGNLLSLAQDLYDEFCTREYLEAQYELPGGSPWFPFRIYKSQWLTTELKSVSQAFTLEPVV